MKKAELDFVLRTAAGEVVRRGLVDLVVNHDPSNLDPTQRWMARRVHSVDLEAGLVWYEGSCCFGRTRKAAIAAAVGEI